MTIMSTSPQRWSIATVYPDMWVDPDDDPRTSDRHSPDGELVRLTPRKPSSPMPSPDWNRSRPPPTPKSADTTISAHTWAEKTSRCGNS